MKNVKIISHGNLLITLGSFSATELDHKSADLIRNLFASLTDQNIGIFDFQQISPPYNLVTNTRGEFYGMAQYGNSSRILVELDEKEASQLTTLPFLTPPTSET